MQLDPNYRPELLKAEQNLSGAPLTFKTEYIARAPIEAIRSAVSETAPFGLVKLFQHLISNKVWEELNEFEQARVHLARGEWDDAEAKFTEATSKGRIWAHDNLGVMAATRGNHDKAIRHFQQGAKSLSCQLSHAYLELEQGAVSDAINRGEEANSMITLNQRPAHMQAYFGGRLAHLLGSANKEQGKFDVAMNYFTTGMKKGHSSCAMELGNCIVDPRNPHRTPESYNQAIIAFGNATLLGEPRALLSLGILHLDRRDFDTAERLFNKAKAHGVEVDNATIATAYAIFQAMAKI